MNNNFIIVSAKKQICGYAQYYATAQKMAHTLAQQNKNNRYTVYELKDSFVELTKTYTIGQKFSYQNDNCYILANTEFNRINLINLNTGKRFTNQINVNNIDEISEKEFRLLVKDHFNDLEEIL